MRLPIILDTDPGIDDAAAIAAALFAPELDLQLMTTVAGNVSVEKTTRNALQLLHFWNAGVPLAQGASMPLVRPLRDAASVLHGLVREGAQIVRGNKAQPIASFADAQAWLLEEAKKGRSIQRFKGLGEMNPEQLWDTTVNPETRRLLQVRIEDAVAADEIFSTLMGDVVEPRRAFIDDNALKVSNLDV